MPGSTAPSSRNASPVTTGGSPSSSTQSQSGKRTRASKPKVRTGCITCKIRRVKCGEEKPACVRCTSTGRTCDGYDKGVAPRNRTQDSLRSAEMAKMEFIRAYQWNEALRSMRPIVADIDGTETEKKFFHRFRLAASADGYVCDYTKFWNRVSPQMGHQDPAVKHAVIALGAAYQVYQLPHPEDERRNMAENPDGFTHESLEVFTIQQYNKAISKLQRHVGSNSPESIQVTLICCLAFICLETLRGNHEAAVTHLINGLKILQSLPAEDFDFLADITGEDPPHNANMQIFDMRDIIELFGQLETSAAFFAAGIRPIVSQRGYDHRRFDDGSASPLAAPTFHFHTVQQAHRSYAYFFRDVLARLHETSQEGPSLWTDPSQSRQHECLRLRATRLEALIQNFLSSPYAPAPHSAEHICINIDLIQFRCAQVLLSGMDQTLPPTSSSSSDSAYGSYGWSRHDPSPYPSSPLYTSSPSPSLSSHSSSYSSPPPCSPLPPPATLPLPPIPSLHSDIISLATILHSSPSGVSLRSRCKDRIFFNDAGIVGPVYLVAVTSPDPACRAQAYSLLTDGGNAGWGDCSGFFWDGVGLRERLGMQAGVAAVGIGIRQQQCGGIGGTGVGMGGLGVVKGAPLVQDALERLQGMRIEM